MIVVNKILYSEREVGARMVHTLRLDLTESESVVLYNRCNIITYIQQNIFVADLHFRVKLKVL